MAAVPSLRAFLAFAVPPFPRLLSVLSAAALVLCAAPALHAQPAPPTQRGEQVRKMTPEQRQRLRQQTAPAQRGEAARGPAPEQRAAVRERATPDQADRARAPEERRRREDGASRLTPEERRQLREQIYESDRDFREQRQRERRSGRGR